MYTFNGKFVYMLCIIYLSTFVCLLCKYLDRSITGEHLPLAWTRSTEADERRFMDNMEQLRLKFLPSGAQ